MGAKTVSLLALICGAALMMWLLSLAQPSTPAAWINLGAVLLLPFILAIALVQGLSERLTSNRLMILALAPMALGLAIAVSPFIGEADAQGGLALFLAPIVQLIALSAAAFIVTRRK